jgi:hypothetical protein
MDDAKEEQPPATTFDTLDHERGPFASLLFEAGATVPYVMAQLGADEVPRRSGTPSSPR